MPPGDSPGILESLRRLAARGVALLQNRVELFSVEIQEQKARLIRTLTLLAVTVFLGCMALAMVTTAVVVLVGDKARGPVLIVLSVLYTAAEVVSFFVLRKELRSGTAPLKETLSELKKDRDWLAPGK